MRSELPGSWFVGRQPELDVLAALAQAAHAGQPSVVWISGAAGTGKTTLLQRGLANLGPEFRSTVVSGDELASDISFDLVRRLGVRNIDDGYAVGQELLRLWSQDQETGTLVLVVEDAHWVDVASLRALLSAVRRLEQDRVFIIVTSRFGPTEGWQRFARDERRCHRIDLATFDSLEVAALVRLYGVELTGRQTARLWEHTGGHPLWVNTLLTELTPAELASPGYLPAPRSLASSVTGRLSEVAPAGRSLAAALAVLNQETALAVVGRVAGIEHPLEALETLLPTGFVRWSPNQAATPIAFTHPLYRQAIYQDLAPTQRRDLHRAASRILVPASVLAHRVAATDGFDEALADELEACAATERAAGASALAARNLLWASSTTADTQRAQRLVVEAGLDFLDAGQTERAISLRPRIVEAEHSAVRSLVLGRISWELGERERAEEWLTAVVELEGPVPDWIAARAWLKLAEIHVQQDRAHEAIGASSAAARLAPPGSWIERAALEWRALGEGLLRGGPAGLDVLRPFLPDDPQQVTGTHVALLLVRGILHYFSGHTSDTVADLRAVIRLAERGSRPLQFARCHFVLAAALIRHGDWDLAMVHGRTALSIAVDDQDVWIEAQCHAAVAILLANRGHQEKAEEELAAAFRCARRHQTLESLATCYLAAGFLARARNDPDATIEHLSVLTTSPIMMSSLQFWPPLVDALLDAGRLESAKQELDRLQASVDDRGLEISAELLPLRARLAAGRRQPERAASLFRQAVANLGPDDPFLDRALTHHAYGRFLGETGEVQAAIGQLEVARQMLASVGAAPFVGRVDVDLEAAGRRGIAASAPTPFPLTDRERDVATLVAQDLTNPEVAAQLYISRKAVEYHLSNIYRKFGIRSRRELKGRALV